MTRLRPVLFALLVPALSSAAFAAPKPFDARDLVTLDRVSSPTLSPDARKLVVAVREADFDANKASTGLWIEDLFARDAAPPVRFTAEGFNVNSPAFSPDGAALYFLSAKSGSQQLWKQGIAGGDAVQVTNYALDVGSYKLSPDGKSVAVSFEVFIDCADLACTKSRLDATAASKVSGKLYDKLFVRHWDTWADGRRNQLYVAPFGDDGLASAEPVRISTGIDGDVPSKPFGDASEYAWAPDGQSLVFSVRVAGREEAWSTNFDLYRGFVNARMAPRNLTAGNPAMDTGPAFSADGKTLYYRAMKRAGFEADRLALMAMDLGSGKSREIAPKWDRSADGIKLSADGKSIYTQAYDVGTHPLFKVDIASGDVTKVLAGGSIGGFDLARDTLAYTRDNLKAPAQAFTARADGSAERQITQANADVLPNLAFGDYEQFNFKGWNNETVHGYVVKPVGYEEGKSYPVAFLIHGGPQGSFGDNFHYRWNPQTYAGAGFAVVMIDFHGSTGYGQAFTDSISQDWGGKPLEDLKKGFAAAQEKYAFLDGDRACALGGSYGGYMVAWIAGNWPDGFKCLVNHAGVVDTRIMGFNTEELWFTEWENGGTPVQVPRNYEQFNPINHVGKWKSPMLVIHGQLDYRVLVEQGLASFSAAQRQGVESQLLYFPDENHWILKPHNSVLWHDTVNDWLKRWTTE
ncbi:MAG: S9 family peptidase [Arenimonas sp.]|uniref:S9 family peptidase n=1 Tax=Arenimonas sp. TaxID=1872635 RepID=UPI0025BF76D3|nr:S9 family peptidase [Arenimonas sp.]MBW8368458.1 S9 family peptidase [Arenimonas sp.]